MRITQLNGMPSEYGWSDDYVLKSADFKRWFKVVSGGYVYIGGMSENRKAKTTESLKNLKATGQEKSVAARSYSKALSGAIMNKEEALFWAATSMARNKRKQDPAWYDAVMKKYGKKATGAVKPVTIAPTTPVKKIKPLYIIIPAVGLAGLLAFTFFLKRR